MNELQVKKYLNFLCVDYNFKYNYSEFSNYLGTNGTAVTYSYYTNSGCFTISNFPVRGEVEFYVFKSLEEMKECFASWKTFNYYAVNIFQFEREIWSRHEKVLCFKNPFAWISSKRILRVLAEVIKSQMNKHGSFFGITIAK